MGAAHGLPSPPLAVCQTESSNLVRYILSRMLSSIPVLIGVTLLAFFAMRLVPGDVSLAILRQEARPELVEQIRRTLGIDRPLLTQLVDWLAHVVRLDFGRSFTSGRPILPDVLALLPATLELASAATLISIAVAIPLGLLNAIKRGSLWDYGGRIVTVVGFSLPSFWLALLFIKVVALDLHLLPAVGHVPFMKDPVGNLRTLILPAFSLGVGMAAVVARYTRSAMLDVLDEDYIRTARSKGLSETRTMTQHALKNALIPVVTIIGIQMGTMIGGTVIVEEIFAWPGLGRYLLQAIYERDYPVVQTVIMVMAFFFLLINLVVDVLYAYLDPRIRYN